MLHARVVEVNAGIAEAARRHGFALVDVFGATAAELSRGGAAPRRGPLPPFGSRLRALDGRRRSRLLAGALRGSDRRPLAASAHAALASAHHDRGRARGAAPPPRGGGPPAPLAPLHADAGLARRGAAGRRRRRGRLPRGHARQPLPRRRLLALVQRPRPPREGDRRRGPRPARPGRALDAARPRLDRLHRVRRGALRHRPAGLTRVFFSDAGATAVEIAIKMAFQHHQLRGDTARTEFVALRGGYHGDTSARCPIGGIDLFHRIFKPLLFDVHHAPQPYCYRCPLGEGAGVAAQLACADERRGAVRRDGRGRSRRSSSSRSMQGADGMIAQPPGLPAADARALRSRTARSSSATRWRPASAAPAPCSRWSRRASSPTS